MAVATRRHDAEDKELLISGSEAVAEGLHPRRHRRRHRLPDPARTTRSCRPSPRRSPTASSWPSTSSPRASTASSRSSSTPPRWAPASSAARRAWAGPTRWSAWSSPRRSGCRWSAWSATAPSTIPGRSASSTTTRSSCATWAGCSAGSTRRRRRIDTTLIAYRVAEDRRVFLPLAISADGAFLTHSQALTMVPPKAKVDKFLPRYDRGELLLHPDNPITVAPQANEDWVIEIRRQNDEAMKRAYTVIEEAYADFRKVFGRGPENPWFEEYMTEDAEIILVGHGDDLAAHEGRDPQHAGPGQEGRPGPAALVPALSRRADRRGAVQGEGDRRDRSRLFLRLAVRTRAWWPTRSARPSTTRRSGRRSSASSAASAAAR